MWFVKTAGSFGSLIAAEHQWFPWTKRDAWVPKRSTRFMRFGVCWLIWSEDPSNVLALYSNGRCVTDMLIVKDSFCFFLFAFMDCTGLHWQFIFLLTLPLKNGLYWCKTVRNSGRFHKHAGIQYARMLVLSVPMQQNVLGHWTMKNLSGLPFLTWSSTWKHYHRFGSPMFLHCVTTRFDGAKNAVVQILRWRNYTSVIAFFSRKFQNAMNEMLIEQWKNLIV